MMVSVLCQGSVDGVWIVSFSTVISLDTDFGQYCRFTVTNAIGRLSNAVSVLGQTNDGAPVRPTLLLLQDVAQALEYHLHWYALLHARARQRAPGLWGPGTGAPCSTAYAASGHELGREDTDAYPSPSHTSGTRPWASARTLAVQHEVGAAELDMATGGDGARVSILHPACYTHDISCLGSTLHSHQQQQRGMGGGEGGVDTPTSLLPCVVPPATATGNSSKEHQMRYLRSLSEQLVPRLLSREDVASPALRLMLRELLAGSLLLPLMEAVAHPHTLNGVLRDALVADDAGTEELLEGMADVATGGMATAAEEVELPDAPPQEQAEEGVDVVSAGVKDSPRSQRRDTGGSAVFEGSRRPTGAGSSGGGLSRGSSGRSVQEAGAVFGHVAASGDTDAVHTPDAVAGSMPSQGKPVDGGSSHSKRSGAAAASARYIIGRSPLPVDSDFDRTDGGGEDTGWLFFGGEQTASRATSLLRGAPPCSFTLRSPPKAAPQVAMTGASSERLQAADQHEQADVIATALVGIVVTYVSLEGQLAHIPVGVHTPNTTKNTQLHGKFFIAKVVDGEENKFLSSLRDVLHIKEARAGVQGGGVLLPSAHSMAASGKQPSTRLAETGSVVVIQDGRVQCARSSWSKLTSSSGRRDLPAGGRGGRPLKVAPVGGAFASMAALLRGWLLHVARYGLLWSASDSAGMPPLVCLYAEDAEGWRSGAGVHSTGGGGNDRGQGAYVTLLDTRATPAQWGEDDSSDSGSGGWSMVGPTASPGGEGGGHTAKARMRSDTSGAVCEIHSPTSDHMHRKASSLTVVSLGSSRREPAAHFHSHLTGAAGRAAADATMPSKGMQRSTALRYGGLGKPAASGEGVAAGQGGGAGDTGVGPPAQAAQERSLRESLQSARAKLPSPDFPSGVIHSMLSSFGGASASVVASDELSRAMELADALLVSPPVPREALNQLVLQGFSAQTAHDHAVACFGPGRLVRAADSLLPRLCLRAAPSDLMLEGLLNPPFPPLSGSVTTATRSDVKGSGLPGSTKVVIRYELSLQFALPPTRAQIPCGGYTSWGQAQFAEALMGYMPPQAKQWSVRLRYSELLALHEQLQKAAPAWRPTASFPGKRPNLFGSNLDKEFIMSRATGLRKWLQGVLSCPALSTCSEVRAVLVPPFVEEAAARAAQWVDPLMAGVMGEPGAPDTPGSADSGAWPATRERVAPSPPPSRRASSDGEDAAAGGAEQRVRFASSPALPSKGGLAPGSSLESEGGGAPPGHGELQGAQPSPLRLAAPAQGSHVPSASADFVLLPSALGNGGEGGTGPSELQAGGGLASTHTRTKRRRRGTMNPLELHALELHVFGVIGALFDLRSQSWLRRNFVTVTRSVGKLLFHGTAAAAIKTWYVSSTGPDSIADWLGVLSAKLWPQQTWFSDLPGYEAQAASEWRAHKQWVDREALLRALRSSMLHSKLPSLLGSTPVGEGAARLHELLNSPLLLRSVMYTVLDALLARMFPGMATHGLRQRAAVEAAWAKVDGGGRGGGRLSMVAGLASGQKAGASKAPGSLMLGGLGNNLQQWFGSNK